MSPDYHALCKRLAALRRHLLPATNPTGAYSDAEYDRTRAFIALSHAEIESFIEDRCLHVVTESRIRWMATRNANRVLFSLYAMCFSGWTELGESIKDLPKLTNKHEVEARVASCLTQYQHVVSDNNGIKEANLKKMLVPLSLRLSDLDPAWLLEMSNFGGFRGQVVHMSEKANHPPDPVTFDDLIRKILLPGLNTLDRELSNIVASAGPPVQRKGLLARFASALRLIRTGYPT